MKIRETSFTKRITGELGSLISTTISNIPSRRLLGEIFTKITPRKKMMGLKYLILDNMRIANMNENCQE